MKMPQMRKMSKNTRAKAKEGEEEEQVTKYLNTKFYRRYDENEDFTVERDQNVSETFNYEKRVIEDSSGDGICRITFQRPELDHVINGPLISDGVNGARDLIREHTYENLNFDLNGSKELLLHKFFGSTERGDAIYQNLCRGCGYGVFEAYGELCYFCASIVNGVRDTPASVGSLSAEHLDFVNNSSNVYENICEKCYAIYSSDECVNCEQDPKTSVDKSKKVLRSISEIKNDSSSKGIKLGKSKSFNKRSEKRSIFQGLIGSLKRSPKSVKSGSSNSASRLEIVHNIDGYNNVFHTQETFDLQRICELKRTQTSSSDQHIYGRLKCTEAKNSLNNSASTQTLPLQRTELSNADSVSGYLSSPSVTVSQPSLLNGEERFLEANSTKTTTSTTTIDTTVTTKDFGIKAPKSSKSGKRPRISKPRLLSHRRTITSEQQNNGQGKASKAAAEKQQALYLPDSVCNWMTSLRREVHNYHSFCGDDETIGLCNPKSIPAKNSLLTYYSRARGVVFDFNSSGDSDDLTFLNGIGALNGILTLLPNELTNYPNIEYSKAATPTALISTASAHSEKLIKSDVSDTSTQLSATNCDDTVTLRQQQNTKFQEQQQKEQAVEQQQTCLSVSNVFNDNNNDNNTYSPVEFAQMVKEFKRNLLAKQHKNYRQMSKDGNELPCTPAVQQQGNSSSTNNNEESKVNSLSSAKSETDARESLKEELRVRRQAIYLKTDEQNGQTNNQRKNSNNNNEHTNNNNSNNNNNFSGANCTVDGKAYSTCCENDSMKTATLLSELDTTTSSESPVSRRRAAQAYVSPNGGTLNGHNRKRCGIYEPNVDSAFVSNILNEFDIFLQNEEDAIVARETGQETDLAVKEIYTTASTESYQKLEESTENPPESISTEQPIDPTSTSVSSSLSVLSFSHTTPYAEQRDRHHNHHQQQKQHQYVKYSTPASIERIFDFVKFNENLYLSRSLNNIIINYHQPLHAFLLAIRVRYPRVYKHCTQSRLIRKYWRFHAHCVGKPSVKFRSKNNINHSKIESSRENDTDLHRCLIENVPKTMAATEDAFRSERNSVKLIVQQLEVNYSEALTKSKRKPVPNKELNEELKSEVSKEKLEAPSATNETYMTSVDKTQVSVASNKTIEPNTNIKSTVDTPIGVKSNKIPLKPHRVAPKRPEPPQVPLRDPKTSLSGRANENLIQKPINRESPVNKMIIPTSNSNSLQDTKLQKHISASDESIYQPIWKFQTVGEVQERYQTDADYYEIDSTTGLPKQAQNNTRDGDSLPVVLISNDVEDHGEWETDDEFMFTTEMMSDKVSLDAHSAEVSSLNSSTAPHSTECSSSLSGSTVAGFSSSTATLASAISTSLTHHLLRSIGIFYSLTEPKLRAIIYDYNRVHASTYFAKRGIRHEQHLPTATLTSTSTSPCSHDSIESNANDSGIGKSPKEERLPMPPPRTTSATKSPANLPKKFSESGCHSAKVPPTNSHLKSEPLLPDSVQAWKFMLLDIDYLEDEEDMIVSEHEILRSQEIKEDIDTRQTQPLSILQRYKSASFGNLVDLPKDEDDKKSFKDRVRNKLQRGVLKLNVRSPKSDKKNRGIFRRAEATSLYLEDGMKPKYPIFGAPLDQLELDECTYPNVPRFVVDCVTYIEQKDCIQQEGLYRASGNKVSIEELKQKLSESYIYDPKLLVIDDIHTLTSLLKLFFRELGAPLIPQETYDCLGRNLSDAEGIETMRQAFDEMREPNRSTLKFLIRHLTNVAACSSKNRMPASNLAIVWGPCIMSANQIEFDIGRMNTLAKVLIENYALIFNESERLVA